MKDSELLSPAQWERAAAMSLLEEMKAFTRVVEQKPTLLLGESAFKLWHERELGMSESEAQQKWDTDSATKSSVFKRKEDGVLKVAVKGHTTIMMETGMESTKKLQQVLGKTISKARLISCAQTQVNRRLWRARSHLWLASTTAMRAMAAKRVRNVAEAVSLLVGARGNGLG